MYCGKDLPLAISILALVAPGMAFAQSATVKAAPRAPVAASSSVGKASSQAQINKWEVLLEDVTLARTIERWAGISGWRVRWDADRHVVISAQTVYEGTFEEAIAAVLATPGIRRSPYPLQACVYMNSPPLLRITRMGDQTSECNGE